MPNNGTYRLRIEEVNNLPLGTCLMIEDLVTGNTIPFVAGQELVISHTGNYSGNRFLIHATPSIETTASNLDCNNANNGSISLDVPQGEWNITLTDTLGQAYTAEEGSYTFNNLPAQVYTVTATPIASGCITTSKTIELSEPAAITFEALNSTPAFCNSSASGVIAWQVTNAPSYEFTVKNANNEVVNSGTSGSGVKAIQGLNADVYTVTLQTYCGSQEFVFDLHDQSVVAAEILSDDIFFALAEGTTQTLTIEQSNTNATNFQWTLSNGFVSNESEFNYEFTEAGIYTLTLVANSETCSATDSIEIVVDRAVSITELNDESNISVLQTSVSLEVYLNYQSSEKTTVTVYDMNGKVISNITTSTWKGKNISIGTGGLATGMYILKVTNNNEELLHKKFINP
jgi:PKD repeat protein